MKRTEQKKQHELKKTIQYGVSRKGAKQWQEDSFFYMTSTSGTVLIGGVFDGHGGYNGLVASTAARDFSTNYFAENKKKCETWTIEEWEKNSV